MDALIILCGIGAIIYGTLCVRHAAKWGASYEQPYAELRFKVNGAGAIVIGALTILFSIAGSLLGQNP